MTELMALARRQYAVFSRRQALASGVSDRQLEALLRRGTIERVVQSVYRVTGAPVTWRQHLMVAVLAAGTPSAVCGWAAAALYALPGFREGAVEVIQTRRPSRRNPYGREYSTTYLPDHHVREVDGLPVLAPERLIIHLCGRIGEKRAMRLVKDAISRNLTTVGALAVCLADTAKQGRAGVRMLRSILAALDDQSPTESELEDLVVAVLACAGLPVPVRQAQVGGTTAPVGRIDFLYRATGIVIEADSKRWHGGWVATEADHRRDARLTATGFHVIRTNWGQLVEEPELFVAAVRGALARAA